MYLRARTDKKNYILLYLTITYYLLQLPESKFNETKNVNKSKIKNK